LQFLVETWPVLRGYKELPIEVQILEEERAVRDISFGQKLWIQTRNGSNLLPLHYAPIMLEYGPIYLKFTVPGA